MAKKNLEKQKSKKIQRNVWKKSRKICAKKFLENESSQQFLAEKLLENKPSKKIFAEKLMERTSSKKTFAEKFLEKKFGRKHLQRNFWRNCVWKNYWRRKFWRENPCEKMICRETFGEKTKKYWQQKLLQKKNRKKCRETSGEKIFEENICKACFDKLNFEENICRETSGGKIFHFVLQKKIAKKNWKKTFAEKLLKNIFAIYRQKDWFLAVFWFHDHIWRGFFVGIGKNLPKSADFQQENTQKKIRRKSTYKLVFRRFFWFSDEIRRISTEPFEVFFLEKDSSVLNMFIKPKTHPLVYHRP